MRRVLAMIVALVGAVLIAPSPAAAALPDMLATGPYPVASTVYDFGDTALQLPGWPGQVEFRGIVHYPTQSQGKNLPLVIFLHGRHATCATSGGTATLRWPCLATETPIDSYRGYDYLASHLASYGYVVASISVNGINAVDNQTADYGMAARAVAIDRHLAKLKEWNTTGGAPFGQSLVGAIDQGRVGLMGHSRGGEGVAKFMVLAPSADFTVKALLPLAPTDFGRHIVTGVAMAVALPSCDGDVSDLQGVHFYDDSRYAKAGDAGTKYTVAVGGANHNFFNTVWSPSSGLPGAKDDVSWSGAGSVCGKDAPGRVSETRERENAIIYVNGFFRYQLGGEQAIEPLWNGSWNPRIGGNNVQVTRHPADDPARGKVINRLETPGDLTTNALGGSVSISGLVAPGLCATANPQTGTVCLTMSRPVPAASEPHRGGGGTRTQPIFKAQWTAEGGVLTNTIPAGQDDFSRYTAIQVRATVDFSDARNPATTPRTLDFTLTDAAGHSSVVMYSGRALFYPNVAAPPVTSDVAPHFLLNQARVPLDQFTGIDLTRIRKVTVGFRGDSGSIGMSDLLLSS